MTPAKPKKPQTEKAHCNTCGGSRSHEVVIRLRQPVIETLGRNEDGTDFRDQVATTLYKVLRCRGCGAVCFQHEFKHDIDEESFSIRYPPEIYRKPPEWICDTPEEAQGLVLEVYRALASDSRRLALMGARALIDIVLRKCVGDQGGFKERLGRLEQFGWIGKEQSAVLTAALEAGNASSHRGYLPAVEDLNGVMDIVEHLLQAVFVLPKTAEEVARRTPGRPSRPDKQPANVVSINRAKER